MLPPIRVLGVGSPFGLDRVGWDLVDSLRSCQRLQPYLNKQLLLEALDRPGANLLRYFEGAAYVVLFDAVVDGHLGLGQAKRYGVEEIQSAGLSQSSHGVGVQQALELALALGEMPQRIELFGISITDYGIEVENEVDWEETISEFSACLEGEIANICDRFLRRSVIS